MTRATTPAGSRKRPWKVDYLYPGQRRSRIAVPDLDEAERQAGAIAQRGGQVTVSLLPQRAEGDPAPELVVYLHVDSGGNVHELQWTPLVGDDLANGGRYTCSCGRSTTRADKMAWHLERFGRCSFCIGERTVRGADKGFLAGLEVDCPVCGGSGAEVDVDYHDVQMELYVARMVALTSGVRNDPPQ